MNDVLKRYIAEVEEDLKIDQFNVKEVQMRAPSRKHFWVARLINTKIELNGLKAQKKKIKKDVEKALLESSPTKLSYAAINRAADNNAAVMNITEQIDNLEMVVEYLDGVVKIMNNIHWEIKNIIELIQMELQ